MVELALDIVACEERLTRIHAEILVLMDRRDDEATGDGDDTKDGGPAGQPGGCRTTIWRTRSRLTPSR